MNLESLAIRYTAEHPRILSQSYRDQFHWIVAAYGKFLGQPAGLEHLTREALNTYLTWMLSCQRSPWTVSTRRRVLLVLARFAAGEGLLPGVPQPKRIAVPTLAPRAWTPDEIRRLVAVARALPGVFPRILVAKAPFMAGLILALYDTGLRLGDALALGRRQINGDGTLVARQSKTGREVIRRLSPATLAEIDASGAASRPLIWPLWTCRDRLFRLVRILVAQAGIPAGSLRWLRRAGVTAITREHGLDAGRRFADHRSAATTLAHYVDPRQLGDVPQPPPLF